MKTIFTMVCAAAAAIMMTATPAAAADDSSNKLSIKPTGRILMDGAVYLGGNKGAAEAGDTRFVNGVAIPDLRLGAKASYGNWRAKIDVGFGYGKVSLKDVYFEYDFNPENLVRGGYFVPQWGLNSETSSSMKPSFEEPTSNEFFNANPRLLALMWLYNGGQFFAGTSVFAESKAMTTAATEMHRQGWGAQTRLVWRPRHDDGNVVQTGISLHYSSPNNADHTGFDFSANFPSRVSKVKELSATVDHAKGTFKLSPELLIVKGRLAFEAQYYYMNVFRKDGFANYRAHGAYGMLRALLIGRHFSYNKGDAGVATPAAKSLELEAGYNYTDASDSKAGIWGGVSHDVNVDLNYYINSWMITRLRYSYTTVGDRRVENMLDKRHVNTIEARIQIIF